MPKLAAVAREYEDVAERFLVVGVHERGPASLAEVRAEFAAKAAKMTRVPTELPPVLALDVEQGWSHAYGPEHLGDMVLLDSRGVVVAGGDEALDVLRRELGVLRQRLQERRGILDAAKSPEDVAAGMLALLESGRAGDRAVADYARSCPTRVVPTVLGAAARLGIAAPLADALGHKDAKRRRAALDVMKDVPNPAWVRPLLAFATGDGAKTAEVCAALEAASASAPAHPDLEATLLELSGEGPMDIRRRAVALLGRAGSPTAKERLLEVLARDKASPVRREAATALAHFEGDDVREALRRGASDDPITIVRDAAAAALAAIERR